MQNTAIAISPRSSRDSYRIRSWTSCISAALLGRRRPAGRRDLLAERRQALDVRRDPIVPTTNAPVAASPPIWKTRSNVDAASTRLSSEW